jgi:ABC-type multidrug transport system ATPase subunit
MDPVLEAKRLRVDLDGVPTIDGLSFVTTGERVLVLAGPDVLFLACGGMVQPRHGELLVCGLSPAAAIAGRVMGAAPLDPPLPPGWKGREYVVWSARLSGASKRDAVARADDALARLRLGPMADVRLRQAALPVRRAVVLAAALATGATTILMQDPLRGLAEDVARAFARTLLRATEGLRTVVFAARASLASPISIDADEALIVDGGAVLGQGAPGEVAARERTFAIRLHGSGASFAEGAEKFGARVSQQGARWIVTLGESLALRDILDAAEASNTVVLELRPLTHAFA